MGVAAINGLLEHPELKLVGCWVHSKAKRGELWRRPAVPAACAPPLGIGSFFELPPITGRAAPNLAR